MCTVWALWVAAASTGDGGLSADLTPWEVGLRVPAEVLLCAWGAIGDAVNKPGVKVI